MIAAFNRTTDVTTELKLALNGSAGLRLFTAEEYQRLAEIGILGEDDRVELIEGRIVQMAAKNLKRAMATKRVNRFFSRKLADSVIVSAQDPILLNNLSEPEPDIVLVKPPDERYIENHPQPEDIFLVLEIADSSLPYDRDVKCPLFARNGIIQFCLLNLQTRELEDYRDPSPNGYRSKKPTPKMRVSTLSPFRNCQLRSKTCFRQSKQNRNERKSDYT